MELSDPLSLSSLPQLGAGRIENRSPTTPRSAMRKMGASASLLMATMCFEDDMPARCWIAPEIRPRHKG